VDEEKAQEEARKKAKEQVERTYVATASM